MVSIYFHVHDYIAQSVVYGCNCTDHVDRKRYGNCQKMSRNKLIFPFTGEKACYVSLPSSCPDLINSPVNSNEYPEKKISAEACKNDPNTAGRISSMHV